MNGQKLPHWDLSPIYRGVGCDDFLDDLEKISTLSQELKDRVRSSSLYDLLILADRIAALVSNTSAYASACLSTDTADPSYMLANSRAEEASVAFSSAMQLLISEASERKDEFSDPRLKDYSLLLSEFLVQGSHQMSRKEEDLALELLRTSANQWERLQEAVTSSIHDGDMTLIQLRGLASSPDRNERRNAFERELRILKEHEVALAYSLNGVKGTTLALEKRRGWKSPLERSLFSSRISGRTLDALISALEDSLPMFRRYFLTKARLLGLERLEWYDISAPVGKSVGRYSFEEARDIIVSSYSKFSPEMGDFARNAFENGWIDAEPRKGKVGGAYDTAFRKSGVSRVLCNYDYSYDSVATLAHELGHAYHDHVVRDLPVLLSDYPMTLAETASIFGETVVFTEVLKNLDKDGKLPVIEQFVASAAQVCVDILSRFYFEKELFERRRSGELSPDQLCSMMLDAQERTYGDAVGVKHPYMWAVKGHYYCEAFSFYNYPYAFGQLFALGLFKRAGGSPSFASSYRDLLLRTGMQDAVSVGLSAGMDMEDPEFWKEGVSVIASYAGELENWL